MTIFTKITKADIAKQNAAAGRNPEHFKGREELGAFQIMAALRLVRGHAKAGNVAKAIEVLCDIGIEAAKAQIED